MLLLNTLYLDKIPQSYLPDIGKATMVKVLTMGKNLHYYGQNDVSRNKVLKQVTVFVTANKM